MTPEMIKVPFKNVIHRNPEIQKYKLNHRWQISSDVGLDVGRVYRVDIWTTIKGSVSRNALEASRNPKGRTIKSKTNVVNLVLNND